MKTREELEQMIEKDAFANAEELAQFSVVEIYARGKRSMLPLIDNLKRQNLKLRVGLICIKRASAKLHPDKSRIRGLAAEALIQVDSIAKELEKK